MSTRTGQLHIEDAPELACLPLVTDPGRLAAMPSNELRETLGRLVGVTGDKQEIARRLEGRGLLEDTRAAILDQWKRGWFSAAHKAAKESASKARGAWEQITGERYGANKAADWQAETPGVPDDDAEALRSQAADLDAQASSLIARASTARERVKESARLESVAGDDFNPQDLVDAQREAGEAKKATNAGSPNAPT